MYRVEDKYICSESDMHLLQARIGAVLRADDHQNNDMGYRVTSVYFDDFVDSHYMDTINGNPGRQKYRIRIYNGSLDTIKLEVKFKQYNRVLKKAKNITAEEMNCLLRGEKIDCKSQTMDDPAVLFNLAIAQRGLRPKVIVEYERKAYVYEPGNVRITFDRNIRASDQVHLFGTSEAVFGGIRQADRVLEVKYDEFFPAFIAQALELGNMIQSTCSKYALCRERSN